MRFASVADDEIVAAAEDSSTTVITPTQIRERLAAVNEAIVEYWLAYDAMIDRGTISVVAETETTASLADHPQLQ